MFICGRFFYFIRNRFCVNVEILAMKNIAALLVLGFLVVVSVSAQSAKVSPGDLKKLEGDKWVGNLTYLDYKSKKPTSIMSNVTITRSKADELTWIFDMDYPLERGANSKDEVKLSADGMTFYGETVIERTKSPDGTLRIVTTKKGKDDNRESTFRHTYLINKKAFSMRKEVKFDGDAEFFERNTYAWTR